MTVLLLLAALGVVGLIGWRSARLQQPETLVLILEVDLDGIRSALLRLEGEFHRFGLTTAGAAETAARLGEALASASLDA